MSKRTDDNTAWYEKASGRRLKNTKMQKVKDTELHTPKEKSELKSKAIASWNIADAKKTNERKANKSFDTHKKVQKGCVRSKKPLFDTANIPSDAVDILNSFDEIIANTRSLSGKQRVQLGGAIKRLSHELTDDRGSRRLGYMNDAGAVSAYINYFMWWNLVRLTRLFANLPKNAFKFGDNGVAIDIGSGPLTVPVALWLSRPELRSKNITWYCMDLSQSALSAGEDLYLSIAAKTLKQNQIPWKIVRVKGALGTAIKQKADLVTCANVFNEIIQNSEMPPDYLAKKHCSEVISYVNKEVNATQTVLLVEPGDPKSGRFVSLMRDALIRQGFSPVSPCPHMHMCPMDGKKGGKWCNFAFDTEDAPAKLQKLSAKSGLPKERAVLSFVLAQRDEVKKEAKVLDTVTTDEKDVKDEQNKLLNLRVTSDFIRLPELRKSGYYCCSEVGLVLAVDESHCKPCNGDLLTIKYPDAKDLCMRDEKSGAILISI